MNMKKIITILTLLLVFTVSADAARCKAITHAGTQCSRTAKIAGYCKQHYGIMMKKKKDPKYDEKVRPYYNNTGRPYKATNQRERCQAITQKGTRCKLKALSGSRYCNTHSK